MQDLLRRIMLSGAVNIIDTAREEDDPTPRFRGANTPNFHEGVFTMDGAAHCPRLAIARKRGVEIKPLLKNILSWEYGRAWEAMVKKLIDASGWSGLTYTEEEGALVQFQSSTDPDKLLYTARPDLLVEYNGIKFPVEIKSSQSNNVGFQVFNNTKPKLGAVMQMHAAMHYHECEVGFTLYGLMHWIQGYDFGTKSRFKLEPDFCTHFFERRDDGSLWYNGKKTIVSEESLFNGLALLESLDNDNILPNERPKSVDLFGNKAGYDQCTYCDARVACDQYGKHDKIDVDEWLDALTMEVPCNDKRA